MSLVIPAPQAVVTFAGRVRAAVVEVLDAVPRLTGLLDAVETILVDVAGLLDRIEATRIAADGVVARVDETRRNADLLLGSATPMLDALRPLLESFTPSLEKLQPTLERLAETTDPHEVDAMIKLVDQLPTIVDELEKQVIPMLESLGTVAPDLHDLLGVSKELNEMLARLPGMKRVKRRVDEEQAIRGIH
ncbi:hypothetical protein GCM10009737_04590 [Nocardioides lentus]|uniref:Ribulose 1,5-bisphosphate carboxylase large subunit n=1 Tax=Nocardioides lentus TaxID=338077 RepID=A0ABP5A8D5_9ACTN